MTDSDVPSQRGFAESSGSTLTVRDTPAEEALLSRILGTVDQRQARWDSEVRAEVASAILRCGFDWGHPDFAARLPAPRDELIEHALADEGARDVVEGYLAHLQEHRADFFSKLLDPTATRLF